MRSGGLTMRGADGRRRRVAVGVARPQPREMMHSLAPFYCAGSVGA